jgi:hypothetical protein
MDSPSKYLLESIQPAVRKVLLRERIRAMRGHVADALAELARTIEIVGASSGREMVALASLRAELLHLNRQHDDALATFQQFVLPRKAELSTEEQFVVEQNLADLQFSLWSRDAGDTFYGLVDRRRLVGFEWFDAGDALAAHDAAAAGKHYDALPILWRQCVRAYLQGC